MSLDSPVSIIYNSDGYEVSVKNNTAVSSSSAALMVAGSDGSNARYLAVDSSGRSIVSGAGSAGTPAGGVLTIQGAVGGQAIPVSGTITATNASVGTTGSTVPSSASLSGATDGTNLQSLKVYDLDTGAGVDYGLGVSIRLPASGGSVAGGTSTNPIRIDPTGTTTQPVSGTVTVAQGTASSLLASVGGLGTAGTAVVGSPVRVGASDGTNTRDILSDTSGRLVLVGPGTAGTPTGGVLTIQGVSGGIGVTVTQGTASNLLASVGGLGASGSAVSGNPVRIGGSDGTNARDILTDTSGRQIIVGAGASGSAVTGNPVLIAGSDGTNARTLKTSSDGTLQVSSSTTKSSTSSLSNVSASSTNVTLLASNSNRLGATVYNDSNQSLYLKLGATATSTSFTVKISAQGYYEVPASYTGQIDGLWSSANGAARVTELT
jgi:hypothetical protein